MRNGKHRSTPARLARLERRFAYWRQNRQRGKRIPQPLWQAAARLAADYGVSVTASAMRLDHDALKERLDRLDGPSVSSAPFITLPMAPSPASECVMELDDGLGARMRIQVKGGEMPDVLSLSRSFWDGP